jgi:hypothetical protein
MMTVAPTRRVETKPAGTSHQVRTPRQCQCSATKGREDTGADGMWECRNNGDWPALTPLSVLDPCAETDLEGGEK